MKALFLTLALTAATAARAQTASPEVPIETTLCDIKAHPADFQHKLVEFTAIASHGFEDSMVEDSTCAWTMNDNPGVWMEFGGKRSTNTMYCCGFTPKPTRPDVLKVDGIELPLVEDELFKQFDSRLHPEHPRQRNSDLVRATMRGVMFVHQQNINGRKYWGGYGHMGCCLLFVVTQVTAVDSSKNLIDPLPPPPQPPLR